MIPSRHAMSVPQLFSHDYYFRIAQRKLGSLRLAHSFTDQDPAVFHEVRTLCLPARRAGITEWEGLGEGHPLSLGWDWMELEDGQVRPVTSVGPRTNIMVIDGKGYDLPQPASAACLWALIATLPWQHAIAESFEDQKRAACSV